VLGLGLTWVTHLWKPLILALGPFFGFIAVLALGLALSFVFLVFLARTVPRLVPTPLVLRHHGPITVLNLTVDPKEQNSDNDLEK